MTDCARATRQNLFSVPVNCLLEAGDVVLRDRMGAVAVLRRRRAGVAGVDLASLPVRVERRLPVRRVSRRGREVLAAGASGAPSGARLPGAVGTRVCPGRTGEAQHGRDREHSNYSHLSYKSHFPGLSFVSRGKKAPCRTWTSGATTAQRPTTAYGSGGRRDRCTTPKGDRRRNIENDAVQEWGIAG